MSCNIPGDIKMEKLCQSSVVYLTLVQLPVRTKLFKCTETIFYHTDGGFHLETNLLSFERRVFSASLSVWSWIFLIFFVKINCCLSTYQNKLIEEEISSLLSHSDLPRRQQLLVSIPVRSLTMEVLLMEWYFDIQIYIFLSFLIFL